MFIFCLKMYPLYHTLTVCSFQTIQAWRYGNNFPIGMGFVKNLSAFTLGFIRSYVCYKNRLHTGMKVQIFHPGSQSLTSMAYSTFALY